MPQLGQPASGQLIIEYDQRKPSIPLLFSVDPKTARNILAKVRCPTINLENAACRHPAPAESQSVLQMVTPPTQDMPPAGGFEAVRYKRNIPMRGPGGAVIFGGVAAVCAYGFYVLGKGNLERRCVAKYSFGRCTRLTRFALDRELKRETAWSRIHLVPLLLAEQDRDAYRRNEAALAREKEIMKDVPGWDVSRAAIWQTTLRRRRADDKTSLPRSARSLTTRRGGLSRTLSCCRSGLASKFAFRSSKHATTKLLQQRNRTKLQSTSVKTPSLD